MVRVTTLVKRNDNTILTAIIRCMAPFAICQEIVVIRDVSFKSSNCVPNLLTPKTKQEAVKERMELLVSKFRAPTPTGDDCQARISTGSTRSCVSEIFSLSTQFRDPEIDLQAQFRIKRLEQSLSLVIRRRGNL